MRNLLNFLIGHSAWFVFALYVVLSCVMLFRNNPYQHHVYLTSAGKIAATVYGTANSITGYFHLREINEDLQQRNATLENEVIGLRNRLREANDMLMTDSASIDSAISDFSFIIAHVINNSITRPHNYITLNRGAIDGIKPEMGVVDQNGVVGIVNVTGEHTSRVISLLNSDLRLSCKVKGNDAFGSLVWDGRNPREAVLEELPRHVQFEMGDTVITSGYSVVFPEGIPVGIILSRHKDDDDNFYSLRVRLLSDFTTLSTVRVLENAFKEEIKLIETDRVNTSPDI